MRLSQVYVSAGEESDGMRKVESTSSRCPTSRNDDLVFKRNGSESRQTHATLRRQKQSEGTGLARPAYLVLLPGPFSFEMSECVAYQHALHIILSASPWGNSESFIAGRLGEDRKFAGISCWSCKESVKRKDSSKLRQTLA